MGVLNPLISLIDLPDLLLVVGAMDMVTPHLGRKKTAPHEHKKKDSWIKDRQKLSLEDFHTRIKSGS